jgi:hypothetical protein
MIREGYEIKVERNLEDGSRIDVTLETLIRIAFYPQPGDHSTKINSAEALLKAALDVSGLENLDIELLYLIIENGGGESYLLRRAKDKVQYGEV